MKTLKNYEIIADEVSKMENKALVGCYGWICRETEKAYQLDDGQSKTKKTWFPKSQMHNICLDGEKISFSMPVWLVKKKFLESCGF